MTAQLAVAEADRRRPRSAAADADIRGAARAASVYALLAVVVVVGVFPLYWSFLIGCGDASTITRPEPVAGARAATSSTTPARSSNDPAVNSGRRCGN